MDNPEIKNVQSRDKGSMWNTRYKDEHKQNKNTTQKTKRKSNENPTKKPRVGPGIREGWAVPTCYKAPTVLQNSGSGGKKTST